MSENDNIIFIAMGMAQPQAHQTLCFYRFNSLLTNNLVNK